ncbi:MAG TPA: hypothetical protein VN513_06090 [Gemmatimonadales bacterium]|nr:hypothetical protein [Gemmatimonadales bacterium]
MKSFLDWYRARAFDADRPWLVFGKGPSFAKRASIDPGAFYTLALNHAVREQRVLVAHMIDLDVVDQCGTAFETNAEVVLLPWVPHVRNRAGTENLAQLVSSHPVLRRLDAEDRLLWYNLCTAPKHRDDSPVVEVRFFSSEAALRLLAMAGARRIRSLGIDGGASYSTEFTDLAETTLLANSRSSFDRQFEEIARIIMTTGVDYAPLDVESPIRVFVAATDAQMLAVKVLEFSIKKHASMSVEVSSLHLAGIDIPTPRDAANLPRTPFSFQRFLIPAVKGHAGRAIYLDSDMQVFKDIRELWTVPFDGCDLLTVREPVESGRKPQFSVMLLDCKALHWNIADIVAGLDTKKFTYEQLMQDLCVAKRIGTTIDPAWNSLEHYTAGKTGLVHYTDMPTQPWVYAGHPLGYLWVRDLLEAVDTGFISVDFVRDHVERGFIRPSLLYQLEHRLDDGLLLPKAARALDNGFVAPYHALPGGGRTALRRAAAWLRAATRRAYQRTPLFTLEQKLRERLSR